MAWPQTGTFRLNPLSATASGAWEGRDGGILTVMTALAAIVNPADTKYLHNSVLGGAYEVEAAPDHNAIVLDGGTIHETTVTFAGLPAGFTVTEVHLGFSGAGGNTAESAFFRHDGGAPRLLLDYIISDNATLVPTPSLYAVFNGLLIYGSGDYEPPGSNQNHDIGGMFLTGEYMIASGIWYDEAADDYQVGDDPGAPYAPVPYPTPRIDSITPNSGPTAGGTAVTITGGGYLNPDGTPGVLTVRFDEYEATAVVVTDQHTLTCVAPAHWRGTINVVVTVDFEAP